MPDLSKLLFADGQETVTLTQAQVEALLAGQAAPTAPAAATVPPAAEPPAADPNAVDPARELAFLKAGVDTSTPTGALLLRAYDGELTADAVKAAAEPLGLIASSASPVTSAEVDQTAVRTGLQHNGTVSPGQEPEVHPIVAAAKDAAMVLERGGSYLDAVAAHVNRVSRAGMEGDTRVLSRGNAGPGEPVQPVADRKGFESIREVASFAPRVTA
jgi:hypothetical protein